MIQHSRAPAYGQIDTTTIYGTIWALSQEHPFQANDWARHNACELMATLIYCDHLRIAPVPSLKGRRRDNLGFIVEKLLFAVNDREAESKQVESAINSTKNWVHQNARRVRETVNSLENIDTYIAWLDWNVEMVWPEHCASLEGLTDSMFNKQIALVLNLTTTEIEEINRLACSRQELMWLVSGKDAKLLEQARQVYVTSILIRGVYYDYLARLQGQQFFVHQVRERCLPKNTRKGPKYEPSLAIKYLVGLLVAIAYREPTLERKMASFAELAQRARGVKSHLELNQDYPEAAEQAAAYVARKYLNLRVDHRWAEPALDAFFTVGSSVLCLTLSPWLSLIISGIVWGLGRLPKVKRTKSRILSPESSLRELASAGPGRIVRYSGGRLRPIRDG